MPSFAAFFESFVMRGLEHFRLYYGVYKGIVTRNDDPEQRGRIQAKVPIVNHSVAPDIWIDPVFAGAGTNRGSFCPPEVGDSVRVVFAHGRADRPSVYFPGWFGGKDLPTEFAYTGGTKIQGQTGKVPVPEKRGFISRKGHRVVVSDEDGKESIEIVWHKPAPSDESKLADQQGDRSKTADRSAGFSARLLFDSHGSITLKNQNGSSVVLDATGKSVEVRDENSNTITMNKDGVTIKTKKVTVKSDNIELSSSDQSAMRGDDTLNWLASHTHGTAWGPSTPPTQPPPRSLLSRFVKLR